MKTNTNGVKYGLIIISCLIMLLLISPLNKVLANEKGEAGNGAEVEFYLESSSEMPEPKPKPKPDPKPDPKPKPIIKLPQTSNAPTVGPMLLGSVLLLSGGMIVWERRTAND